jgi:cob(I)alamin adenosyltransferase
MRLERGLVHVYTGDGRGKTSAAMTVAMRAAQHGYSVLIVQFVKEIRTSEQAAFEERFPEVEFLALGEGFFKILNDRKPEAVHQAAAQEAFRLAGSKTLSGRYDVVVLDEVNNAVDYGFIPVADVVRFIRGKPKHVELILTGRNAAPAVQKLADYVSDIKKVKHPYDRGILARKGIDF